MKRRLACALVLLPALALMLAVACGSQPTPGPVWVAAPTASPTAALTATATLVPPSATATPTAAGTGTATPARLPLTATPTPRMPSPSLAPLPPSIGGTGGPTPQARSASVPAEIERGNSSKHQVALTFDAGASALPLPKILAALRQAGVRATFFLTGAWAKENPAGVKAIIADGHEIANHSNSHPDFTTISDAEIVEELQTTEEIIQKIAGRTTKPYFRPPFGARDRRVLAAAWSAGYRAVYWTIDSGDWREDATVDGVVNKILSSANNGAIFIEHVSSPQTAEGLPRIIAGLREKGFEITPLSAVVQ